MRNKDKTPLQEYGEYVKKHRTDANLTQKQLADKIGISHEWLCKIEKGKAKSVSTSLMDKISNILNMNVQLSVTNTVQS